MQVYRVDKYWQCIINNNHPLPKTETKKYKQRSINKLPLVSLFQVRTLLCNKIKHESYD
jgi:hypothetical protein